MGVPIEDLDKYIFERVEQLKRLDADILLMAEERNDLSSVYKTTIPELEEFQQLKPIHEKLIKAENEISKET